MNKFGEGTLFFAFAVPSVWPPKSSISIFVGEADGADVKMFAQPPGVLQFAVKKNNAVLSVSTPIMKIPDYPFLKVAFSWGGNEIPVVAVNGALVVGAEAYDSEIIEIKAVSHPPTNIRSPLEFVVPKSVGLLEQNLLRSLLELQQRIATADHFNLLQASGIIRRLILDKRPLVHLVNQKYRMQLRFPFVKELKVRATSDSPTFGFVNPSLDFAPPDEIDWLSIDAFLKRHVLHEVQKSFSVRDVIYACANIKGGIHVGDPHTESEEALLKLDTEYLPFFADASLVAISGIGWSLIHGLRPLVDEVIRQNS